MIARDKNGREGKTFSSNSPHIRMGGESQQALKNMLEEETKKEFPNLKKALVFDNHGKIISSILNGLTEHLPRFYQKIGSDEGFNLCQSLESPPSSGFGFAFFIYTLVEAALTRIVIIDERIAQATIDGGKLFGDKAAVFQKAGIISLLQVHRPDMDLIQIQTAFLSETIENAANNTKGFNNVANDEGCTFNKDDSVTLKFVTKITDAFQILSLDEGLSSDVLVIHEGVTDMFHSKSLWNEKEEDSWKIFDAVPFVIRTSGRGMNSRYLGNWLPFIEFTELSGNTYGDLNKLTLTKALLGTSGNIIERP